MESKFFHCLHLQTPSQHGGSEVGAVSPRALALCSIAEAREALTQERAHRLQALPLGVVEVLGDKTLTIAVACGRAQEAITALRFSSGLPVRATEVSAKIVEEAIFIAYCGDENRLLREREALRSLESAENCGAAAPIAFRPESGEVGKFLASLIEYGFSKEASDIHLIPKVDGTIVRIRVHGELLSNADPICSPSLHQQLAARVKVLSGIDSSQRHLPLDGAFTVPLAGGSAHVRVSTVPTVHGEKIVLRLLGSTATIELDQLEFEGALFDCLERSARSSNGAIIVAGPTGSGKSSTLYALAARAASNGRAVSSVEDPVERIVCGLAQSQVHEARGLTFPVCLRSIVRQDPDVIMVGEMRDAESAGIAIQAALTGHLLLTSVHSGTIPGIVRRIESLGIDSALIAETVLLLINQRLLPVLCERCKVISLADSEGRRTPSYRPVGCRSCDYSGFSRRVPVAQAFMPTEIGRELLRTGAPFEPAMKNSGEYGWIDWDWQLARLLSAGKITLDTARSLSGSLVL